MIASPRLYRLATVSLIVHLTVPLCVGSSAQTQTRDPRQASIDNARAHLAEVIAQEKEAPRAPADDLAIATVTGPRVVNEGEPNNTAGFANSIGALVSAEPYLVVSGAISPGSDSDYYMFGAAAGARIWIATDTGGPQGAGATSRDSEIHLLASDGTTVIENDDDDGTGNGGDGINESGQASMIAGRVLLAGGNYYIRVKGFAPANVINPYRLFIAMTTATATVEAEGNNTAALANVGIPNGASFGLRSGSIVVAGDADYYSVAATAGSVIYYSADADPERDGAGTDLVVELRGPSDVLLHMVDSSTVGNLADPAAEGSNFTIPTDGVYFIKVRHFNASGTGTYHLLTAVSVPAEDEPNDTAATAEAIEFTSSARRCAIITGAIDPPADVDFYSFQAAAGSRVWISTDTGGPQNPGATSRDTVLDLLASDGVTVIENDNDDGTGNGGDGTIESTSSSIIGGRVLVASGTYFIRVTANSAVGNISPYKLFVVLTNARTQTIAESESNDTVATADVLIGGAPIAVRTGAIGLAGDADYYSIVVDSGTMVYFNVDADPERDGGTDLVVEFRSPADVLLLSVNSSLTGAPANPVAEGANFIVTDAPGTYYLKVRHFNAAGTGTYNVMAIVASGNAAPGFSDDPVSATVSTIRAVHFTELRARINTLRNRFGLAFFPWSHPSLGGLVVDADHLTELRTAIAQAYTAAGLTVPAFTDPALVPQSTAIKAVHIEQLRAAVIGLESS
jgi:hypothetical protein